MGSLKLPVMLKAATLDPATAVLPASTMIRDLDADRVAMHDGALPGGLTMADMRTTGLDVAWFGAVGDGATNDQPAIQRAIAYAEAHGIRRLVFRAPTYAVWSTLRTSPTTSAGGGNAGYGDGEAIIVTKPIVFQSLNPGGTTLYRRNVNGQELGGTAAGTNFQLDPAGKVYRGAGVWLNGPATDPGLANRPALTLIDMTLDGGADRGPDITNGEAGSYPARPSDGYGWDVTHRAIYCREDHYVGPVTLIRSKLTRFRGELIYQGGSPVNQASITATGSEFSHCSADLINPCGTQVDLTNCWFLNGRCGWEGWGGAHGRILGCTWKDCTFGIQRFQGGQANTSSGVPGGYYVPTRIDAAVLPWLDVDASFINCGVVMIGSFVRGILRTTDSLVLLQAFNATELVHDVDIVVYATLDQGSGGQAVGFFAGAPPSGGGAAVEYPGAQNFRNIKIEIHCDSSDAARLAGRWYEAPVEYFGSFGDNVVIQNGTGTASRFPQDQHATPDKKPIFRGNRWRQPTLSFVGCVSDAVAGPVAVKGDRWLAYATGATGSTATATTMATAGYQDGTEVRLVYDYNAPVGSTLTLAGTGAGMKLLAASRALKPGQEIGLAYSAVFSAWVETGFYPYGG